MQNKNSNQLFQAQQSHSKDQSSEEYNKVLEERLSALEKTIRFYQQEVLEKTSAENATVPRNAVSHQKTLKQKCFEETPPQYKLNQLNSYVNTLKEKQQESKILKENQEKAKNKNKNHMRINVMRLQDKDHVIDKNIFNLTIGEIMDREPPFSKVKLMRQIQYLKNKIEKIEQISKVEDKSIKTKKQGQNTNKFQHSTINPQKTYKSRQYRSINCGKIFNRSSLSSSKKQFKFQTKKMIDESTFYKWYPMIHHHKRKQTADDLKSKTLRNFELKSQNQLPLNSTTRVRNIRTAADKNNRYIKIEDEFQFDETNQNKSQFKQVVQESKTLKKKTQEFLHETETEKITFTQMLYQNQVSNKMESALNEIKSHQVMQNKQKQEQVPLKQFQIIKACFTQNFKKNLLTKLSIPDIFPLPAPSQFNSIEENEHLVERLYESFKFLETIPHCRAKPIIKKYINCLSFQISKQITVNWHYNNILYFGGWKISLTNEGVKDGQGFQYIPGKYIYKGGFKEGKRSGYGVIKMIKYSTKNLKEDDGMIYEGDWFDDKVNGEGRQLLENGDQYIGQWKNGQKTGKCKIFLKSGEIFEGQIIRGVKFGQGYEKLLNDDEYFGEYEAGKFHGRGRYKWANGSTYEGQFVHGVRVGLGLYKSINGDQYEGEYLNNLKEGYGIYTFKNGQQYKGYFKNDLKHGEGFYLYPHGKVSKYMWKEGVILKKLYSKQEEEYKSRNGKKSKNSSICI